MAPILSESHPGKGYGSTELPILSEQLQNIPALSTMPTPHSARYMGRIPTRSAKNLHQAQHTTTDTGYNIRRLSTQSRPYMSNSTPHSTPNISSGGSAEPGKPWMEATNLWTIHQRMDDITPHTNSANKQQQLSIQTHTPQLNDTNHHLASPKHAPTHAKQQSQ